MIGIGGRSLHRPFGFSPHPERFGPFPFAPGSFTPPCQRQGRLFPDFLPLFTHGIRTLWTAPFVRALAPSGFHRLSALLCPRMTSTLRSGPLPGSSVASIPRQQDRSPGVISAAFHAQSSDLRFPPLMDVDFAVHGPLVQRWRLISADLFIDSPVCYALLSDTFSRQCPCAALSLHLHQVE